MADNREGWTPARVGCHWTRGPYTASTVWHNGKSGYILVKDRRVIAEFIPWDEVNRLVESNA